MRVCHTPSFVSSLNNHLLRREVFLTLRSQIPNPPWSLGRKFPMLAQKKRSKRLENVNVYLQIMQTEGLDKCNLRAMFGHSCERHQLTSHGTSNGTEPFVQQNIPSRVEINEISLSRSISCNSFSSDLPA